MGQARKIQSDNLPISPLIFTRGEQSEIWHQLLTPVAFELPSFQKKIIY